MPLTGRFRSIRDFRITGLAFASALAAASMPAEARVSDPGIGGPISSGFFRGLPIAPEARARRSESELTGVAGNDCYVLRQVVRDRLGASFLRTVRVCE